MTTKILIGIAIILIIVFLFKQFHKLRLFFIKIFFGKYSYKYMSFFKKRYKKSPFSYCMKDDAVQKIMVFFDDDEKNESFQTAEKIEFGDIKNGEDFNKFKISRKNPNCFNAEKLPEDLELRIIGYNEKMFDMHLKALYYFLDNKFFMGEYVFKDIRPDNMKQIIDVIKEKYKIEGKINTTRFIISDQNNNKLHFFDTGFSLLIKYFSPEDENIVSTLENHNDNFKSSVTTRKKESVNELKEKL